MKSMTGFGRGVAQHGSGRVLVELRSVNHKYLDIRVSAPAELAGIEAVAERAVRERFSRGRIEASFRIAGSAGAAVTFDEVLAKSVVSALGALGEELGLEGRVTLGDLTSIPGLFRVDATPGSEELTAAAREAVEQAVGSLDAMRSAEGEALARDFEARLETISAALEPLAVMARATAPAALERLRARLERLLGPEGTRDLDEGRLAQEAAILADKTDVSEELTRLASHVAQFRSIARSDGPVGRRLEFLLQEMSREASTIGAKAQDAGLQHAVVDLRGELSRMREQVHNVE